MGGDRGGPSAPGVMLSISIHAPAWGATSARAKLAAAYGVFQFTPPRGGRPVQDIAESLVTVISIHVPAWGRRADRLAPLRPDVISIHAPAWGATTRKILEVLGDIISIHAPAWGATDEMANYCRGRKFQFTPPRGGRPVPAGEHGGTADFNSRPREGGDCKSI